MPPINDPLVTNMPDTFDYELVYIPGAKQNNALFNKAEAEAALAQTQEEHNAALNKYLALMQYPPAIREQMGKAAERQLVRFNPNEDRKPRRLLTPSSSAVSSLKITPRNTIAIKFGNNPTTYEYRGGNTVQEAARAVLELLNAGSIGHNVNTKIPGTWGAKHKM